MKLKKIALTVVLMVFAGVTMAHAYSYSFDIISGAAVINVPADGDEILLQTTSDLIVDFSADPAPDELVLDYLASYDLQLVIGGFLNYSLMDAGVAMGQFSSINPASFVNPDSMIIHEGNQVINADFPPYALENASLYYHLTVTPDDAVDNRYHINIPMLLVSGGNTEEILAALMTDIQSAVPLLSISLPIVDFPISVSGSVDIEATPTPVPSALWLFGSGIIGLIGWQRKS